MKNIVIIVLFSCYAVLFGQTIAILPIETYGISESDTKALFARISEEHFKRGMSILDIEKVEQVMKAKEYNLSEIVSNQKSENYFGNLLAIEYLAFYSFTINPEYLLIDSHITNVATGTVFWQKTYTTKRSFSEIMSRGITEIVGEAYGTIYEKSFFDKQYDTMVFSDSYNITRWARSNNASVIIMAFGILNKEKLQLEYSYEKKITLFKEVQKKVLVEYEDLKNRGEYVVYIHLGDKEQVSESIFEIVDVKYKFINSILAQVPNSVVLFYGTKSESAIVESFLDTKTRLRFWSRWLWND